MKHVFIVNPVSGKKDAGREMIPALMKAAESCGVVPDIEITVAPLHGKEIAREYASKGEAVRLYSIGGDGTLNEVFAGAWQFPNAEVACIPCGSGNDFIRSFGPAESFLNIEAQIRGRALAVDLAQVGEGICAAIASAGLDAEVAYSIPKYRRVPLLGGSMAYNISILENLVKPIGREMTITIDGNTHRGTFLIAAVCNGRHYGGGYNAAPMAKLDDGLLDVILVKKISRLLIASVIGKYKKGQHYQQGRIAPDLAAIIEHHRARQVDILPLKDEPLVINVDGECSPQKSLTARVMPLAGRFVLPEGMIPGDVLGNAAAAKQQEEMPVKEG